MSLVALPVIDGTTAQVETNEVTSLMAMPTSLLPSGTPAGTYVGLTGPAPTRIPVVGTVAAVAALLGGASGLLARAAVGDNGALEAGSFGVVSSSKLATGSYEVVLEGVPSATVPSVLVTAGTNGAGSESYYACYNYDGTTTIQVRVFDGAAAGVAVDGKFSLMVSA